MLMEPYRVSVPADEFIRVHAINGRRAADSDLLAVHEDGHEVFLALLFRGTLGGG